MRKPILAALLLTSTALAQPISVQLDGRYLQFDQPPASVGGRLMVPLRGIFEALQAEVVYSAATRSIKATKGSTVVELTLGSRQALINGKPVYLDVPADTLGGRTMVPLRFVSESLGADVKWNGGTRTVLLSSGEANNNPNPTDPMPTGEKPRLDNVIHSATRHLNAGDSFDVVITGDPGGEASFEILGALRQQSVPEVRPGRYERRFVVPNGLSVQEGVLVAHLSKNGMESLSESNRTLNIGGQAANPSAGISVIPAANSEVNTTRPTITVDFNEPIRRNSARLFLDQVELATTQRQGGREEVEVTPQFDLTQGNHQVQAEATSRNGQKLTTQWTFRVDQNQSQNNFQFEPGDGQTVSTSRPRISASFPRNLNNWRLLVDGTDFTSASSRGNQQIAWMPTFDLNQGNHQAQVSGTDPSGRLEQRSWNFNVGFQNNNPGSTGLNIDNLTDGSRMPVQFDVSGTAVPNSSVSLTVRFPKNTLGGVFAGQQDGFTVAGKVDANGRYRIPLHIGAVPLGARFTLTVSDTSNSPNVTRTLFRQ